MKFGGQGPGFDPYSPQGFPGPFGAPGAFPNGLFGNLGQPGIPPGGPYGAPAGPEGFFGGPGRTPGGSIRNTLGSGLKSSGVFQKDGQLNNMRGGFLGPKQAGSYEGFSSQYGQVADQVGNFEAGTVPVNQGAPVKNGAGGGSMGKGPFSFLGSGGQGSFGPRQLILQPAADGIAGNGVATISPDNSFMLVANLPPPQTFLAQGQGAATYAAYLVDKKGKNGFLAGTLRPIGSGVYQARFRSNVPLTPYDKVVISVENPQYLAQAPAGPIILKVKEPAGPSAFLNPAKKAGGTVWSKITGLFRGKAAVPTPAEPIAADAAGTAAGTAAGAAAVEGVIPPPGI